MADFWDFLDELIAESPVVIDRPKGSPHPGCPDRIYPLDYGYLAGTRAGDGQGVDVWIGSRYSDPVPDRLDAVLLTVDLLKKDIEVKLLLGCTPGEKQVALEFLNGSAVDVQEEWKMRALLLERGQIPGVLAGRRSVRRFAAHPLPRSLLERLIEAATWAPSAHNRQPWRFVVLTEADSKERLVEAMAIELRRALQADGMREEQIAAQLERRRGRILGAPAVVLLCLDTSLGDIYPDERRQQAELLMGVQSVAMAGENLLLAAHAAGLGGVWVCAPLFAPQAVRGALALPQSWLPQGLILLGYPAEQPEMKSRAGVGEVAIFEP